jgi:polyisoprenoid-binding protein YceI
VLWEATKKFGQHNGEVGVLKGDIKVEGGEIVGGSVILNMNDISVLDLEDESDKKKLLREIQGKEIFDTKKYPEVIFELLEIRNDSAIGNLTIKNKTEKVGIPLLVYGREENENHYSIVSDWYYINREHWNLEWSNWLKNGIVDEEFKVKFKVVSEDIN